MSKRAIRIYQAIIIQTLFCCCIDLPLSAQSNIRLQQLALKDGVLENNLLYFVRQTKAKIIEVLMEKRDSAYLYRLSGIYNFDRVEDYPITTWGQWRNQIIIMIGGAELSDVCLITNSTPFSQLLVYVHSEFSQTRQHIPKNRLEFIFKVKDGREEWFKDNQGYDSRDFPQPN